jgi:hypothetical protein
MKNIEINYVQASINYKNHRHVLRMYRVRMIVIIKGRFFGVLCASVHVMTKFALGGSNLKYELAYFGIKISFMER